MNKKITIGRDVSCNIQVKDSSGRVSRGHATLHINRKNIVLEDHSINGTLINGKLIHNSSIEIREGDDIFLGSIVRLSWNEIDRFLPGQKRVHISWGNIAVSVVIVLLIIFVIKEGGSIIDVFTKKNLIKAKNCNCRIFTTGNFDWTGECVGVFIKYANDNTGLIKWDSGRAYYGNVTRGNITGKGEEYKEDSILIYEGDFLDGKWSGYGIEYDERGNIVYEGGFLEGKRSGKGIEYKNKKKVYEGGFKGGKWSGDGIEYDEKENIIYKGGFREGKRSGKGTEYKNEQKVYEGDFEDNKWSGKGTEYKGGKKVYEGGFEDGKWAGYGIEYDEDSIMVYKGEFEGNKKNGYGTLYYPNSDTIRHGLFKDDKFVNENKAQKICEEIGRTVVLIKFLGGTNIKSVLYSYNEDENQWRMTLDLTFNGNVKTDNYYKGRIIAEYNGVGYPTLDRNIGCNNPFIIGWTTGDVAGDLIKIGKIILEFINNLNKYM